MVVSVVVVGGGVGGGVGAIVGDGVCKIHKYYIARR